jgi:hypothetical protein
MIRSAFCKGNKQKEQGENWAAFAAHSNGCKARGRP